MQVTCTLDDCPPGLFLFGDCLGVKSEYRRQNGSVEAFVVATGEAFWGGTKTPEDCNALRVIPVELVDTSSLRFVQFDDPTP